MTPGILFFSRGKGRGHAVPDAAIANEVSKLAPHIPISFVSYSTGALTLQQLGWPVVDLRLPEDCPLWEAIARVAPIISTVPSTLVVSHEEFAVPPLAKGFGKPVLFLTDWFVGQESPQMQALSYADEILFLDDAGRYDEPAYLAGKVRYVGPVLRRLATRHDRITARAALEIDPEARVLVVAPGGAAMHSETRAPLFDLVTAAFDMLTDRHKLLIWITADPDFSALCERSRSRTDVRILAPQSDFTATLLACDLLLTKGNRLPLLEAEVLGLPSISLSYGHNMVDDWRVSQIETNTALRVRGLSAAVLSSVMARRLRQGRRASGCLDDVACRTTSVAARLHWHALRPETGEPAVEESG